MALSIILTIFVFLIGIQIALPYLVKRTVIFGVTVPEQFIHDENLKLFKKRYFVSMLAISIVIMVAFLVWMMGGNRVEEQIVIVGTMMQFGVILISLSLYIYFHAKTKQLKKESKWTENLKEVRMTDLSIRSQDEMLPSYMYVLPMIVTLGVISYTIIQYDILPNQIPTHWGPSGEPDAFTRKSPFTAIQLPLLLLIMQIMFLSIHIATKKSGIKLSATNLQASRNRQLGLRKYSSWFTFVVVLLVTMLLSYFQLTMIHSNLFSGMKFLIPFAFLVLVLIGTIIFALKVGRTDKGDPVSVEESITDIDEDRYWKGGLFYFNKNDPSIFVEKRFGVGWTLNMANPIGYFIVLIPLVIILLIAFI